MCYSIDRAAFNQGINAQYDPTITDDGIAQTIVARGPSAVCVGVDGFNGSLTGGVASTLGQSTRMSSGRSHVLTAPPPTFCLQGNGIDRADTAGCNGKCVTEGVCYTLNTIDRPAVSDSSENYVVRRLTPLECERLQGFPDNWTRIGEAVGEEKYINDEGKEFVSLIYEYTGKDGKKHRSTDTERYKALGNSIAIPPWKWVLKRLCAEYERDATMASLFDGIGGFPLIWEQLNGRGSCLWASEIEPFPIAVTTAHFNQ